MIPTKDFIKSLRKEYKDRLGLKTGWGRNELIILFDQVINDLILDMLASTKNTMPVIEAKTPKSFEPQFYSSEDDDGRPPWG